MRTSTGLVELTGVNLEVKCGGVVVRINEMLQVVSFQSMSVKTTKRKTKRRMRMIGVNIRT
jgi:hypothetical protein